jgi:hypothetical protein
MKITKKLVVGAVREPPLLFSVGNFGHCNLYFVICNFHPCIQASKSVSSCLGGKNEVDLHYGR